MPNSERLLIIILRFLGVSALFAIPAIFFPYTWMNAIHRFMGLGEMPDSPIVSYLARSLSAFYATFGGMSLLISTNIRLYRQFVLFWGIAFCWLGTLLLGIDIFSGMPTSWTIGEGPLAIVIGLVILWLQRKIINVDINIE